LLKLLLVVASILAVTTCGVAAADVNTSSSIPLMIGNRILMFQRAAIFYHAAFGGTKKGCGSGDQQQQRATCNNNFFTNINRIRICYQQKPGRGQATRNNKEPLTLL